ncbi:MAG TPA: S-methyl-5-thioribose-1-phosphate isomerase [Gemmatimonadaceae bacterium]|nr:S-methyl-5-thioribose-1-phosphate isomerase [Gemmatimonadaceae bacterium]
MQPIAAVQWAPGCRAVRIIDQRLLPGQYVERDLATIDEICDAIRTLAVRGAPAIGVAGALGLAALLSHDISHAAEYAKRIRSARPTAVNLAWAIDRVMAAIQSLADADVASVARDEATAILEEDRAMCRRIGEAGAALIPDGARILTHCNAGALATSGIGTALAPVYMAAEHGRRVEVFADETRPLMQGARLTAWELSRAGIPVTVIPDSAAASLLRSGKIDLVLVGADRIAANGDAANKIGTYSVAIAAKRHGVPFYVVAPTSTFDPMTGSGEAIPIEERGRDELTNVPAGASVFNPAFDVTPAELITAFVSDRGVHHPPYRF